MPEILKVWHENLISRTVSQWFMVLQLGLANNMVYEVRDSKTELGRNKQQLFVITSDFKRVGVKIYILR